MKTRLIAIAAIALCSAAPLAAEEPVEVLRTQVDELKADLDRPLNDFDKRYEKELNALQEKAQQSGDLDLALAVSEEIANFKDGASKPATDEKLKRLQGIYTTETERLIKDRAEKIVKLLTGYKRRLDEATAESTKAGDLDSALTYRNEAVTVDSQISSLLAATAPAPSPDAPATEPEPKEEKEVPEFVAGVYRTSEEGFGPTITFDENGRYNAGFFGSGKWRARSGGKMVLNGTDEFDYIPERDIWKGTINLGGERELILKRVKSDGDSDGRKTDPSQKNDKDDGDRPRRPGFPGRDRFRRDRD